jgi:hypothetical protein
VRIPRTFAPGGPAPSLDLLECRVADAGTQSGQDRIVVREARHEGVQPAAAAGVKDQAGGGEQAYSTLRVVLLSGEGRQDLEIVGGAGFVAGLGRQRQPLLQVCCRPGRVPLALPGQRQVVQRTKQGLQAWARRATARPSVNSCAAASLSPWLSRIWPKLST